MKALASVAIRKPWLVIIAWIIAVVGVQAASAAVGDDFNSNFALDGTDSQAATDLLVERFPGFGGGSGDQLVWTVAGGQYDDAEVRAEIEAIVAEIAALDTVINVSVPFDGQAPQQVSPDGTVAYATINYDGSSLSANRPDVEAIVEAVKAAQADGIHVAVGGQGVGSLSRPEFGPSEAIGVVVAAIILFMAFGSFTAMALPLISAIAALGVGMGTMTLASHVVNISDSGPIIGALLGLGVGIDYALFVVNRHRRNILAGREIDPSIEDSINTSGRAVVFAGIAVIIALAGMFVPGIGFLQGMAIGAAIAVVFTVVAAITLLPALLKTLGLRVLNKKARARLAAGEVEVEHAPKSFLWWAAKVQRHPLILGGLALAVLLTLAIPTLSLRLGSADQGNDPAGTTTREAYDMLADGFGPGFNGPLLVAVDLADNPLVFPEPVEGAEATEAPMGLPPVPPQLAGLIDALRADATVAAVIGPIPNQTGDAAIIQVVPVTSPQDVETSDLVKRIRTEYAADAAEQSVTVHVGGVVAVFDDFATEIQKELLLFFSVVILLGTLLVVVAFRSIVVPAVGAVMNVLSIGAAFGVVVAIFQWGWMSELIGIGRGGPIEPFIPIIMFALVFGLSMDYQVFLVSRIAEEWHALRNNTEAVRVGQAEVGRIILAAAGIMVFVFAGFALSDSRMIKLFGIGLAVAVLIDALLIRMTLVPAIMHLIGKGNWWLPAWLDKVLPHISLDEEPIKVEASPSKS